MEDAKRDFGEPVELARSDLGGTALLFVPAAALIALVLLLDLGVKKSLLFALAFAVIFAAPIVFLRWWTGRNAIFADDKGLIVVVGGRALRSFDWDRIREASWYGGSFWFGWDPGGLVVKTDDAPGTGSGPEPGTRVGSIVTVLPRRRREMGDRVRAYLATRFDHNGGTE